MPVAQQRAFAFQQNLGAGGTVPALPPGRPTTARRPARARPHQHSRSPRPWTTRRAGSAENSPRLLTRIGLSWASSNSTGSSSNTTGDGSGSRPGHGSSGSHCGTGSSPSGIKVMHSAGPRPPDSTGACTASGPSKPCTRTSARRARSRSSSPGRPRAATAAPRRRPPPPPAAATASPGRWDDHARCGCSTSRPVASTPGRRWRPRSTARRTATPGGVLRRSR
ncbi:hypothetical protein MLM_3505 [Mycobacterium lepraemurium]|nr:hypothetical protein MLM_3505 [Mycobacterium lepraemurium]